MRGKLLREKVSGVRDQGSGIRGQVSGVRNQGMTNYAEYFLTAFTIPRSNAMARKLHTLEMRGERWGNSLSRIRSLNTRSTL